MAIKRALISVSDKTGIIPFAQELAGLGVEIISTGGTYQLLKDNGIPVTGISDVTGFPEIMDGRVKTLHPAVHGGLLAVRSSEKHRAQMEENGIRYIDLVAVNLYPFAATIAKPDATYEDAVENIDIGGPTMLRSAAKNHADVTVLVDAADYPQVLEEIHAAGDTELATRKRLAAKVFRHTAHYDSLIADYLTRKTSGEAFPETFTVTYEKAQELRYGENPHQQAAFYRKSLGSAGTIAAAEQLHGKELSYNNINDANAAVQVLAEFTEPAAVGVKHMNPCGVGIGSDIDEAYCKAYDADPISIFGGIIAVNRTVEKVTAERMHSFFLEIVIAPDYTDEALAILKAKKNIRLLKLDVAQAAAESELAITSIQGGALVQETDKHRIAAEDLKVVTDRKPTEEELKQLLFAWKVVKHVKSNAIVLANGDMTVGVGAGQMNRIGSAKIAVEQAGEKTVGSVMASDAYFPMSDTLELAAKMGITAVIHPGGSIRDADSIQVANEHGIAMVTTGIRHFKH
ncbi:bifunctional phosphoribosylaminoimidazolecarboxamide formyltransferase/IMP cyclohydrolase [Gorillibacterium timonense]|uniref:bifunctional phosphoribosylaminoimidazolecarboxamide formyltransferase/IMP cyclohydrolase n=1 Tax=Gorillibacterium timonense TaxID=1689269 RepID=UPI00071DCBFD|nr:bifunctional phosphoribosylaminoimidazolecarboxamide formyltransferase/IMP cyclohydrolase [Gorillibacterium timonense]